MVRIACFALLAATTVADARMPMPQPQPLDISGSYDSTYGVVTITQRSGQIHGEYPCCGGGTLDGHFIDNATVKFHWSEPRGAGQGDGIWHLRNGKLEGSWGRGQSDSDGGVWNLWRHRQIAQLQRSPTSRHAR